MHVSEERPRVTADQLLGLGLRSAVAGVLLALSVRAMTLNVVATVVSGVLTTGIAFGVGVALFWHSARSDQQASDSDPNRLRRRGWGSWVIVVLAAAMACLAIGGEIADPGPAAEVLVVVAVALAFTALGMWAYVGGAAVLGRHLRVVKRAAPGLSTAMFTFLGIGLVLGFFGWADAVTVQGLRAHGVTTDAVVTDVTQLRQSSTYFLRYQLPDGRAVKCSTEDVLGEEYPGDHITVLYDATDPANNCQSADYGTDYDTAYFLLGSSVACLVAAAVLYLLARRRTEPLTATL